jgi:hypothetical protein
MLSEAHTVILTHIHQYLVLSVLVHRSYHTLCIGIVTHLFDHHLPQRIQLITFLTSSCSRVCTRPSSFAHLAVANSVLRSLAMIICYAGSIKRLIIA